MFYLKVFPYSRSQRYFLVLLFTNNFWHLYMKFWMYVYVYKHIYIYYTNIYTYILIYIHSIYEINFCVWYEEHGLYFCLFSLWVYNWLAIISRNNTLFHLCFLLNQIAISVCFFFWTLYFVSLTCLLALELISNILKQYSFTVSHDIQ